MQRERSCDVHKSFADPAASTSFNRTRSVRAASRLNLLTCVCPLYFSISAAGEFVEVGGLISYRASMVDLTRRSGMLCARCQQDNPSHAKFWGRSERLTDHGVGPSSLPSSGSIHGSWAARRAVRVSRSTTSFSISTFASTSSVLRFSISVV